MAWIVLLTAGVMEVAFALLLKASDGFSRLWPTLGFVVAAAASLALLNLALRDLPVSTAYAVWTATGAVGTAIVGMVALNEPASAVRVVSVALIVSGVVGLNLAGGSHT